MKLSCFILLVIVVQCFSTISAVDHKIQCKPDNSECTLTDMTKVNAENEINIHFAEDIKARNLNKLTMSKVDISNIVFNKFPLLEDLSCTYCKQTELNGELFQTLTHMKKIDFSNNDLTKLEAGLLTYSQNWEEVNFEKNKIVELAPQIFKNLNKLKLVKLSDNKLIKITPNTFRISNEFAIELEVDLNNNNIVDLYFDKDITIMRANNNSISIVRSAPSPKMKKLYLNSNQLNDTALECFTNMTILKELSVTGNKNLNTTSLKRKDLNIIADKINSGSTTFSPSFLLKVLSAVLLINVAYN